MLNFYKLSIIPNLLKNFKVKKAILTGPIDENLVNEIIKFDAEFIAINTNRTHPKFKIINGNSLDVLKFQVDYEAIFIDDDPNWYTIYNELNLIKKANDEFPIVFICNNTFPHKRRDSYVNPENIPQEFRQEYIKGLPITYENNEIIIEDEYYHACDENTARNGVLTAIEDFLNENPNIQTLDLKFLEDITILCPKNTISKIRIDNVLQNSENEKINDISLTDKLIENHLLLSYLDNFNITDSNSGETINKKILEEYKNKIHIQDSQIKFKNSQIRGVNSELNVKDLQIKNIESKLVNRETEINSLENQLKSANNEIKFLKNELIENKLMAKNKEADYKFKINTANEQIGSLKNKITNMKSDISQVNNRLKIANEEISKYNNLESEIKNTQNVLNDIKKNNTQQIKQINSKEYCIHCYKEEISNNRLEISYFKNQPLFKKLLSPLSYLYLILKSHPRELSINFKLYKALKNSKCFNIGYYLNNNKDIQKSTWIKYFSPELHYVCNGFGEKRRFNKRYYNRQSKEDLLEYLLTCDKE